MVEVSFDYHPRPIPSCPLHPRGICYYEFRCSSSPFFKLTYVPFNKCIRGEFFNLNDVLHCIIRMFYNLSHIYLMKWFWNVYILLYIVLFSSQYSIYEYRIYYPLLAHEHLDCIWFFALINRAVVNILVWISLSMYETFYSLCI